MGKRKSSKEQRKPYAGQIAVDSVEIEKNKNQKKTYSLGDEGKKNTEQEDGLFKVQISAEKEGEILDLILESKKKYKLTGSVSKRLTAKKLSDLYNTLHAAGFKHGQIENAMSNTVQYGGDLIDSLDWLCLYTNNDQLPEGFSEALIEQEEKKKPRFEAAAQQQQQEASFAALHAAANSREIQIPSVGQNTAEEGAAVSQKAASSSASKAWILQYAEQSDEEGEPGEGGAGGAAETQPEQNVNDRYLEVVAKLEDAKCLAAATKKSGDKSASKQVSGRIRDLTQEKQSLERHPDFDKMLKMCNVPSLYSNKHSQVRENTEEEEEEGAMGGFALLEEMAEKEVQKPQPKPESAPAKLDKRNFEYTKKQWTGKSPKQFLIDWIRKHLQKSPPPKYSKKQVSGNWWKSKCTVIQKEGDPLEVCPDIVCDNLKDAEHLASMLALYHLCKGQRVYQLLPPPYRDVWLEWQDAENKHTEEKKEQANKPRDQFVAKLIKKLKIEDSSSPDQEDESEATESTQEADAAEESWEDRLDNEDDFQDTTTQHSSQTQSQAKSLQKPSRLLTSEELLNILKRNHETQKHLKLLETRKQLPVYQFRESILSAIHRHNVLVIAGETGSGKSTQIPQFLLEAVISSCLGSNQNIICTQPRRISTTSLATRVSDEIGSARPGSESCLCGYQIRFEVKRSPATRLLYCTTGVLLRKLQQDPHITDVSHVIVDEVHERSVQSDFLLIILKQLLQKRPGLKVILMSATVDASKFSSYFQHCPVIEIPGRTFPVSVCHLEDVVMETGYSLEEDSPYSLRYEDCVQEEKAQVSVTGKGGDSSKRNVVWTKDQYHKIDQSGLDPGVYDLKTRNIVTRTNVDRINMELILELLVLFDTHPEYSLVPGAVLVFMPGLAHIQELHELLSTDRRFSDTNKYRIIALHSVLSSQDQNEAFTVPPSGIRKIVIATNIAETGITIPDVVFVIDSGKVKENRYIETTQMSSLEEVYVSKASAKQRQGRAGRVREGYCFRLYSKHKYESLRAYSVPEILRVPLEELCLHIMKCELGAPSVFLSQAVDPPPQGAISRAMAILTEVGACRLVVNPTLTPLGEHLASLPVNVRVGKMLIYGAILGCLDPISVIGAAMTEKSCFAVPMGKKDQANLAKSALSMANSDHITLLRAYLGWKIAQKSGYHAEMQYCNKYFLKRSTLLDIQNVSNDLKKLIHTIGFDSVDAYTILKSSKSTKNLVSASGVLNISECAGADVFGSEQLSQGVVAILKAVLTAGLYPQVAKISHEPAVDAAANPTQDVCQGHTTQGHVSVHPASVNRFLAASGFLVYHEKVRGSRVYVRDCSLVRCYPLLLFGGDITVQHKHRLIGVDNFIQFKAFAKTGVIFKELRFLLDNLLERKLANPKLNLKDEPLVSQLLHLIVSER